MASSELGKIRRYHRGEVPDSRDVPPVEWEGYAFPCPRCGFEFVHIIDVRAIPGPYDGRLTAEVGLSCENGCLTSLVFGSSRAWLVAIHLAQIVPAPSGSSCSSTRQGSG